MSGSDLVGAMLAGRYRVTRQLGHGGMGAVYEAVHERLGKRVAIKVLLDGGANGAAMARFEQEARLASSIGNEHIIDIVDIDRADDGRTYIVMELLEGQSLAQLLAATPGMSEQRIAGLGAQAARALAAAHAKGVVHRDIKPENLFVIDRGGRDFLKIVDFGISKLVGDHAGDANLTRTGTVIGTAAYMSPEQARGDELDARVDIYSLGVVLYQAATGTLPFAGDNVLKVLNLIVSTEATPPRVRRPELSAAFERTVMTAMSARREERFATAGALAEALERLATGIEATATAAATAPTIATPAATAPTVAARPTVVPTAPTIATPAATAPPVAPSATPAETTPTVATPAPAAATAPTVATPVPSPQSPTAPGVAALPVTTAPGPIFSGPHRARWLLVGAALLAGAIVAGIVVVAHRGERRMVEVVIHTEPEGAAIFDEDRLLGPTPLTYRFAREDRIIQLTAQMRGFDIACFKLNPADDNNSMTVRMPDPGTGCGNSTTRPVPR